MGRLQIAHTTDIDWGAARPTIERDLNKLGKCCIAHNVPNATLEANYLSVGFAGVAPEACELLTIVLVNGSVYWSFDDGANWLNIYLSSTSEQSAFATGTIIAYAGDAAGVPANWLICDGSIINRNTYDDLFNVIGETYGNGDGSTTFQIPDMRGKSSMGGNYAGLDNGVNGAYATRNLNDSPGTEEHQLIVAELPTHSHSGFAGGSPGVVDGVAIVTINGSVATGSYGGDGNHENMSPSGVGNFIIRT